MNIPRAIVIGTVLVGFVASAEGQDFCWYDDYGRNGQCVFFTSEQCEGMVERQASGYCKLKPEIDVSLLGTGIWADIPNFSVDSEWEEDQALQAERAAVLEIAFNEMLRGNFNEAEAEMRAVRDLQGVAFVKRYAAAPSPEDLKRQMRALGIPIWSDG